MIALSPFLSLQQQLTPLTLFASLSRWLSQTARRALAVIFALTSDAEPAADELAAALEGGDAEEIRKAAHRTARGEP